LFQSNSTAENETVNHIRPIVVELSMTSKPPDVGITTINLLKVNAEAIATSDFDKGEGFVRSSN
jgi:hypothetical protein